MPKTLRAPYPRVSQFGALQPHPPLFSLLTSLKRDLSTSGGIAPAQLKDPHKTPTTRIRGHAELIDAAEHQEQPWSHKAAGVAFRSSPSVQTWRPQRREALAGRRVVRAQDPVTKVAALFGGGFLCLFQTLAPLGEHRVSVVVIAGAQQ